MSAVTHDIRTLATWPTSLYLDASILEGAWKASTRQGNAADAAAEALLRALPGGHCAAWTSVLAVQETYWRAVRQPLYAARNRHRAGSLDALKTRHPTEYAAAWSAARRRTRPLVAFVEGLPIAVRGPRVPLGRDQQANRAVCFLVRRMLGRYDLEMADLFHIAFAAMDGTNALATLDPGWAQVDGIEVYTVP